MEWLRGLFGSRPAEAPASARAVPAPEWMRRGNQALAGGRFEEASHCYAEGVRADPGDPTLRLNLGFVLLEQGQAAEAIDKLEQALALRREGDAFGQDAHFLIGRAQVALGRPDLAVDAYAQALKARPDFTEAREEGARALHHLGRHAEAAQWARELAAVQPSPFNQLLVATELSLSEQFGDAFEWASRVCELEPGNFEASAVRFNALVKLRRFEQALAEAERGLAITQSSAAALVNVSIALHKLGRLDDALERLEKALQIAPGRREALIMKAAVQLEQLRVEEAAQTAREGLQLHPDDADLHWHLAVACLLVGDFENGWRESEWRTGTHGIRRKASALEGRPWRGESLEGRSIFLHGEQGFGDNIQFVRLVPELAAHAGKVFLQVPDALEPLVPDMAPNCELLPQRANPPQADFHCSLMSLPAQLDIRLETIPARVPYLRADPGRTSAWREKLGNGVLNAGIAWSGRPGHVNDHNRSIELATFSRIASRGCRFVTLQPDLRAEDRAALATWDAALDAGAALNDFGDTAALIDALDLVISVDTSVAHLAGALGKPVWILLPYSPDWRWMLDREDSPWYPTARLFRQDASRRWEPVLERVRDALAAFKGPASA